MPLTTYVPGEVLTAASLNANLVFAAANPVASPSGLNFISTTTFTSVTSVSLPTNTFTTTYENYRMFLKLTALTTDADFTIRLRSAGVDETNANYNLMFTGITYGGTASNQTITSSSSLPMSESDATLFTEFGLMLDIILPKATAATKFFGFVNFADKAGSLRIGRHGTGVFALTTSFDSLTFISSVASSISGTVTVYGYANS